MKVYRVRDWDSLYENNRTRSMKFMQWIPITNKQDGDGYIQVVEGKNGAEMLGGWLAILQVASKCRTRGTLLRSSGHPHDAASISAMSRLPADSIQNALDKSAADRKG